MYSEKATISKFYLILLSKSKKVSRFSHILVAFSAYMNFIGWLNGGYCFHKKLILIIAAIIINVCKSSSRMCIQIANGIFVMFWKGNFKIY